MKRPVKRTMKDIRNDKGDVHELEVYKRSGYEAWSLNLVTRKVGGRKRTLLQSWGDTHFLYEFDTKEEAIQKKNEIMEDYVNDRNNWQEAIMTPGNRAWHAKIREKDTQTETLEEI